jgi:hypothetical protein
MSSDREQVRAASSTSTAIISMTKNVSTIADNGEVSNTQRPHELTSEHMLVVDSGKGCYSQGMPYCITRFQIVTGQSLLPRHISNLDSASPAFLISWSPSGTRTQCAQS